MTEKKILDLGSFNVSLVAEKIAAAVLVRRHDFMTWPSDGTPETLDGDKLAVVVEEEVIKGLVHPD